MSQHSHSCESALAQCGMQKARAKPPKATSKPYNRHILGIDSGLQSHPKATPRLHQGYTKATPKPPPSHPHATPKPSTSQVHARKKPTVSEPEDREGTPCASRMGRLWRRGGFEVVQSWPHEAANIATRRNYHDSKADHGEQEHQKAPEMMGFQAFEGRGEGDQANQGRDDDYGVHADALPIAAAQVEPHPEFIEGERQREPVGQRGGFGPAPIRPGKQGVTSDRREEEDAVVRSE